MGIADLGALKKGDYVWSMHPEKSWLPSRFKGKVQGKIQVSEAVKTAEGLLVDGEVFTCDKSEKQCVPIRSIREGDFHDGIEDMAKLNDVHEASLLHTLRIRLQRDTIYTWTGPILISVNPYFGLPLYGTDKMARYNNRAQDENPPHVYAVGDHAYREMLLKHRNQSMIISGESGAGKTEATKHILQYFASLGSGSSETTIHHKILASNPLLEAFGNAKTLRNDNSSRFGKFIEILFENEGQIQGAKIEEYLLEKIRVVQQANNERNYHIFYQMLAKVGFGAKYGLSGSALAYHYTNQGNNIKVKDVDDSETFDETSRAMADLNITGKDQEKVWQIMAAVLHLGNVHFMQDTSISGSEAARVDDIGEGSAVWWCAKNLGLDVEKFSHNLVTKLISIKEGTGVKQINSHLNISQAEVSRDALAMEIYSNLFEWIVERINFTLQPSKEDSDFDFIGILDIFGFEVFDINRFEQLCINYANEKLQQYFQHHVLGIEQEIYAIEGVSFRGIYFENNKPCVDLIDGPGGILLMLDEEVKLNGTDNAFLNKLHRAKEKHSHYTKPKLDKDTFILKHFAGLVTYVVTGFCAKNKGEITTNLKNFIDPNILISDKKRVEGILAAKDAEAGGGRRPTSVKSGSVSGTPPTKGSIAIRTPAAGSTTTVTAKFRSQLNSLVETIGSTHTTYVRCVKPNEKKLRQTFDGPSVLRQLRYSGMLEYISIRQTGFGVRRDYKGFLERYSPLAAAQVAQILGPYTAPGSVPNIETYKAATEALFTTVTCKKYHWRLGKTLVFLCDEQLSVLESRLAAMLGEGTYTPSEEGCMCRVRHERAAAITIQSRFRRWRLRRKYLRMKAACKYLQPLMKCFVIRIKLRNAKIKKMAAAEQKRIAEERQRRAKEEADETRNRAAREREENIKRENERREREAREKQEKQEKKEREERERREREEREKREREERERKERQDREERLERERKEREDRERREREEAERLRKEREEQQRRREEELERQRKEMIEKVKADKEAVIALKAEMEKAKALEDKKAAERAEAMKEQLAAIQKQTAAEAQEAAKSREKSLLAEEDKRKKLINDVEAIQQKMTESVGTVEATVTSLSKSFEETVAAKMKVLDENMNTLKGEQLKVIQEDKAAREKEIMEVRNVVAASANELKASRAQLLEEMNAIKSDTSNLKEKMEKDLSKSVKESVSKLTEILKQSEEAMTDAKEKQQRQIAEELEKAVAQRAAEVKQMMAIKSELSTESAAAIRQIKEAVEVDFKSKLDAFSKMEKERTEAGSKQTKEQEDSYTKFRSEIENLLAKGREDTSGAVKALKQSKADDEEKRAEFLQSIKELETQVSQRVVSLEEKSKREREKEFDKIKDINAAIALEKQGMEAYLNQRKEADNASRELWLDSLKKEKADAAASMQQYIDSVDAKTNALLDSASKKLAQIKDDYVREQRANESKVVEERANEEEERLKRAKQEKKEREERLEKDKKAAADLIASIEGQREADMKQIRELREAFNQDRLAAAKAIAEQNASMESLWQSRIAELERERAESIRAEKANMKDLFSTFQKEMEAYRNQSNQAKEDIKAYIADVIKQDAVRRQADEAASKKRMQQAIEDMLSEVKREEELNADRINNDKTEREKLLASLSSLRSSIDSERSAFRTELLQMKEQMDLEFSKRKSADANESNKRQAAHREEFALLQESMSKQLEATLQQVYTVKDTIARDKDIFTKEVDERRKNDAMAVVRQAEKEAEDSKLRKAMEARIREETVEFAKVTVSKEIDGLNAWREEVTAKSDEMERKFKESSRISQMKVQESADQMKDYAEKMQAEKAQVEKDFNTKYQSILSEFKSVKASLEGDMLKSKNESKQEIASFLISQETKLDQRSNELQQALRQIKDDKSEMDSKIKQKLDFALQDVATMKESVQQDKSKSAKEFRDMRSYLEETVTRVEQSVDKKVETTMIDISNMDVIKNLVSRSKAMEAEHATRGDQLSKSLSELQQVKVALEMESETMKKIMEQRAAAEASAQLKRTAYEEESNNRRREAEAKSLAEMNEFIKMALDREVTGVKQLREEISSDRDREESRVQSILDKTGVKIEEAVFNVDSLSKRMEEKETVSVKKFQEAMQVASKLTTEVQQLRSQLADERVKNTQQIAEAVETASKATEERNAQILTQLKETLSQLKADRANADRSAKEKLQLELKEISALKVEIQEANAKSMKELANLRESINNQARERESAEAEERRIRRKQEREEAANFDNAISVALSKVEEMRVLYDKERAKLEETELARTLQWEKDRKARLDLMSSDRMAKMDLESKAASEAREAARLKRARMEEETKAMKAALASELEQMEQSQKEAKQAEVRLKAERAVEEKRRNSLYQKLMAMDSRPETEVSDLVGTRPRK